MKKLSLRSILIGFGIGVFVPFICFLILRNAGHTGHIALPKNYGIDTIIEKNVDGKTVSDTVYHQLGETHFVSHLNTPVNLATDYPRKSLVINFFTTNSNPVSEKLTYHMSHIQEGFKLTKHDTSLQLISIATDPAKDNIEALRPYANLHSLDHDTWSFLAADSQQLKAFATKDLFLSSDSLLSKIVLVDKWRNIRGYYNGVDSMEIKRLIDDIAILMVERNRIHEKSKRR